MSVAEAQEFLASTQGERPEISGQEWGGRNPGRDEEPTIPASLADLAPEELDDFDPTNRDLRSIEAIELDIEIVSGPGALAITPEVRHEAVLRLIVDLSDARSAIYEFVQVLKAMRS